MADVDKLLIQARDAFAENRPWPCIRRSIGTSPRSAADATAPRDRACPPPCPACGGLECLCRPRFFAGQVLTEDDLNRLENYVIAKDKLHNRYFHGSGVVCGLEVVCDPATRASVTVKPGYALSPCGDDIIVCKDAKVDICDLINRCKPRDRRLRSLWRAAPTDCKDGIQRWVLSICYDETPSRGVQPLMSEPCACQLRRQLRRLAAAAAAPAAATAAAQRRRPRSR